MKTKLVPQAAALAARVLSVLLFPACLAPAWAAQSAATGAIEGRVANATGSYLGNARVTLGPAAFETFTDPFGFYRFPAVPAGTVRVRVFYTGYPGQERAVAVAAGQRVTQNFVLDPAGTAEAEVPVKLDSFIVEASRDMTAAALAINEQRFTQQIKTVVSTDTFGDIADGNVGEFVKFLPGVSLGFSGGHASTISVGGMPPDATPITIDGNHVASAAAETRAVQLEQITINNMARVEVIRSRTPDLPARGIGGSVNLIPKSAFERRSPIYTIKTYGNFRDHALREGPYRVIPNVEANAIVPVTPRFGFAMTATIAETQSAQYASTPVWVPTGSATSSSLPATAPALPYLARYEYADSPKGTRRQSVGFTADFRLSASDVLSAGLQWGFFNEALNSLPRDRVIVNPGRVVAWGPDFTQGAAGAGTAQLNYSTRDVQGTTYQPNLRWRHHGPVWKLEAGGAFSRSSYHDRNVDKGFFGPLDAYARNLTVRFDHHAYLRPGGMSVTTATGQPGSSHKLDDYRLETVGSAPVDRYDVVRSANAYAQREFAGRLPVVLKVGVDCSSQTRDIRSGTAATYAFVGADGMARTADDAVAGWYDPRYVRRRAPWGLPRQEGISSVAVYDVYRAHPGYFQQSAANEASSYRSLVNGSKNMTESIYAPYLRFDVTAPRDRRWTVTGGARFEQTEFEGAGPLINPGAIYERDAAGRVVRDAAGQPVVLAPLATLAGTKLAYRDRGAQTERSYGGLYPSLSVSYSLRPDLIGRLTYAKSISRPNMNHILPSLSVPDETSTARTITLSNPNLAPWEADSYGVALEYYFSEKTAGLLSARGYLREIKNFFGAATVPLSAEMVDVYGLDPNIYGVDRGYIVSTRVNIGDARVSGAEFDYRQNLTFLPAWARGLAVFANLAMLHLEGGAIADFSNFVSKTVNYGVSFNRTQFTARVSVNERGRERRAAITGAGVEAGTYQYMAPRTTVDVTAECRFLRRYALYAAVRNLFNTPEDLERYGPATPGYAKLYQRTDFRPLYSVGLKGTF